MASGTCSPSKPMASARAAWAPISPSPVDSGVAAMTLSMAETPWSACPGPTASRRSEAGSRSVVVAEDHRTGGHAHPAADQHVVDRFRLAGGSPPDQPGALGDVVHAVDVGLGQQPSMGVVGQAPIDVQSAIAHHVLALAPAAEAEALQLHDDFRA